MLFILKGLASSLQINRGYIITPAIVSTFPIHHWVGRLLCHRHGSQGSYKNLWVAADEPWLSAGTTVNHITPNNVGQHKQDPIFLKLLLWRITYLSTCSFCLHINLGKSGLMIHLFLDIFIQEWKIHSNTNSQRPASSSSHNQTQRAKMVSEHECPAVGWCRISACKPKPSCGQVGHQDFMKATGSHHAKHSLNPTEKQPLKNLQPRQKMQSLGEDGEAAEGSWSTPLSTGG